MLTLEPEDRGPQDPMRSNPPMLAGSVRRTTSIDTSWPGGFDGDLVIDARARDIVITEKGSTVVDEVALTIALSKTREILAVRSTDAQTVTSLVGTNVAAGFRRAISERLPEIDGTALHLLLDDLPGAALVSGYAMLRGGVHMGPTDSSGYDSRAGMCAGWVGDGVMMVAIRETGTVPTPIGPPSGDLDSAGDGSWHELPSMAPVSTRRRRLLDVRLDADDERSVLVEAMFRDSHADEHCSETSVHEYAVSASVDRTARTVTTALAVPHVLPWVECPSAAASADRLVGQRLDDLRDHVRRTFTGASTCTHLNDTLRGFADVGGLLDRLE